MCGSPVNGPAVGMCERLCRGDVSAAARSRRRPRPAAPLLRSHEDSCRPNLQNLRSRTRHPLVVEPTLAHKRLGAPRTLRPTAMPNVVGPAMALGRCCNGPAPTPNNAFQWGQRTASSVDAVSLGGSELVNAVLGQQEAMSRPQPHGGRKLTTCGVAFQLVPASAGIVSTTRWQLLRSVEWFCLQREMPASCSMSQLACQAPSDKGCRLHVLGRHLVLRTCLQRHLVVRGVVGGHCIGGHRRRGGRPRGHDRRGLGAPVRHVL